MLQLIVDIVHTYIALLLVGYNPCKWAPCKNGRVCMGKGEHEKEYVCTCKGGYTGTNCTGRQKQHASCSIGQYNLSSILNDTLYFLHDIVLCA